MAMCWDRPSLQHGSHHKIRDRIMRVILTVDKIERMLLCGALTDKASGLVIPILVTHHGLKAGPNNGYSPVIICCRSSRVDGPTAQKIEVIDGDSTTRS